MRRRRALRILGTLPLLALGMRRALAVDYPAVEARALAFPRDHGSHPAFRTEWWYVTGWTEDDAGVQRGVQVTFFRVRPGVAEEERSAFAPLQLLFAHAALADPAQGRLRQDQRAARAVFGLARASEATTDVVLDDWSLVLDDRTYRAHVPARGFALDLAFTADARPMLNGAAGVSRKGPDPAQASFYYSRPQLRVAGTLALDGRAHAVRGRAWLDHEWSSEYLARDARGWDWTGINLDDGGALMAFRIRKDDGSALWTGGTRLHADGRAEALAPAAVRFSTLRTWRSPRTGVMWPVAQRVVAGDVAADLVPLMDDQELDARESVGALYWEGAVTAKGRSGTLGRGYLELTGYAAPLRL